jgi:hypothetical protein
MTTIPGMDADGSAPHSGGRVIVSETLYREWSNALISFESTAIVKNMSISTGVIETVIIPGGTARKNGESGNHGRVINVSGESERLNLG